jgi:hypothetical protein
MAIVRAVKTGVWSDVTVWNTGALPTSSDDVYSNTFTVTIDVSPTVLSIQNRSTTGVTAGGGFITTNGITITCTGVGIFASTVSCVVSSLIAGQSCTIVSNLTGGSSSGACGAINNGNGTLNVIGNTTGGSITSTSGASLVSGGVLNVTGTCFGAPTFGDANGVDATSTGTVNITGDCYGPNTSGGPAVRQRSGSGSIFVTGNLIAGNGSTGTNGLTQTSGTVTVIGSVIASSSAAGVTNTGGNLILTGPFITSAAGINPVYALKWFWANSSVSPTYYQIRTANLATIRPLYTADSVGGNPAVANVRSGTVFGPANELTGTCAVPGASSVASGVPVDNTTGTAILTQTNVQDALTAASAVTLNQQTSSLNTSGSIGERLKLASTVATTAQQLSDALSNE